MDPEEKLLPEAKAILFVEARGGHGRVKLPDSEPTLLTGYDEQQPVTIPGRVVIKEGQVVKIGRDISNDLILDVPNVSRFHAILTASNSGVRIADLSSTNGTFVNGNPVSTPHKLGSGDSLEIGPAKLKVELVADLRTMTSLYSAGTRVEEMNNSAMVTVLVADIRDFTTLSEMLPGEDVAKMLQAWFERVALIIEKYGGKIDKYIGDCVMAFWRCTDFNAKILAIEAAKAALEIKEVTEEMTSNPEWPYADKCDWDCRVSLNTGQVMIGKIGGRGARDFTVLGDVVNVAFRLNSVAGSRGYDLVLGDATAGHISENFPLTRLGPIAVKGRNQRVVAFTLADLSQPAD
jgi:adenylate cyclase